MKSLIKLSVGWLVLLQLLNCSAEELQQKKEDIYQYASYCPDTVYDGLRPVAVYSHTSDYSTYHLHLVFADGTVYQNSEQLVTIENTDGVNGAKLFTDTKGRELLLFTDSSENGKLLVYDLSDLTRPVRAVSVGSFPQEIAVHGSTVYVSVMGDNTIRYFTLTDACAPVRLLSLPVGNKPVNLLKTGGVLYVTNQDWEYMTDPSVSIIDLITKSITRTVKVGENPAGLLWNGSSLFSYDSMYYGGAAASLSYDINSTADNGTAPTVDLVGAFGSERPAYGGAVARAGGINYALFSEGGWGDPWFLYRFTATGVGNRDDSKDFKWIGSHPNVLYQAYDDGGTWKLTGGVFGSLEIELPESGGRFILLEE